MSEPRISTPRRIPWLSGRGETAVIVLVSLLATAATMFWSFQAKARCGGAPFDAEGRSANWPSGDPGGLIPCYSDLMYLWLGRDINNHVFPYIHGGIAGDGTLFGGVVEYPVLSGLLMYVGAIGADTDTAFFTQSALLLAPFGFAITVMLALMVRWWALLWAATPPLVLYSFHNWELPVVATAVAAIAVMAWGGSIDPATDRRRLPLRACAVVAAVLLAIGFCLKLYPGIFVLPLAAYVLTGDAARLGQAGRRGLDWVGAAWVAGAAVVTVVAIQLPFMVLGFDGWKAALTFQGRRRADVDTNSIWYWGLRYLTGTTDTYHSVVGVASPVLILVSFAVAMYLGWRRYERIGVFPWIGVSGAMLAGFMLFHKVHSPQYTLWILPFFVLMRVRWQVIAVYLLTDIALDLTIFRLFPIRDAGDPLPWWVLTGVAGSVWVHAVLLVYLIGTLARTPLREPLASKTIRDTGPRDLPGNPATRPAAPAADRA
ncbi:MULTISPECIES: membrane protein [Gordonia]|uniref:Membrane protein n=1 Tax=Gordonia alkanivorans CGMCC 6845 TaxID=1423140 RepID=W9DI07_9ACTN|nr:MULTISPECIES: membrane protein [Gordonia]ETA08157.1 membrane protein [Gordonia alkanivorans CGMCC 6845]MDH3006079.1 hypothetical protein [Gordonia alkanivorans]MDH3011400.1 hypothetical protein [Gordonia alkanivorans]MDH3015834.1 hypothetical protein [Gordonia alkanivorans]MDH3020712.1 hypothetical protein [Gordonia alkanivorans]